MRELVYVPSQTNAIAALTLPLRAIENTKMLVKLNTAGFNF